MPTTEPPHSPTYCFSVYAARDASVMSRVLELFAKRGLVPLRFHGEAAGRELAIDLQVRGLAAETAAHIARCLGAMVAVERVLTAVKAEPREAGR